MNDGILGNVLAAFMPALLLDLHGNLLYVNENASKLLNLRERDDPPDRYSEPTHYDHIIGSRTGMYWPVISRLPAMGLPACVNMRCGERRIQWQLTRADKHYLLTGSETVYIEGTNLFDHLPFGLQQFTDNGIHIRSNRFQDGIWNGLDLAPAQPGYNFFDEPLFLETGLTAILEDTLNTGQTTCRNILLGYRSHTGNNITRILPAWYEAITFTFAVQEERQLFLMLRDITTQQLSTMQLEKSARLLDLIIEHLPVGYIQFDHFGFIRRINQAQREFFQYRGGLEETHYNIMNDPFARLYGLDEIFQQVMLNNEVLRLEKLVDFSRDMQWTGQDREIWLDLTIFPLQDPVDKEQIVVMLVNDITDSKLESQMRNQLQRNTEQLRLFFDAVDMGYARMEQDGTFSFVNRKAEEMAGRSIEPGSNIHQLIPELGLEAAFELRFTAALTSGLSESFSEYFPNWEKWYDFMISPMKDGSVSVFVHDITDSRNMQRDLSRVNRELNKLNRSLVNQNQQLEEFAHITSHNLRAPIANLKALMQMYMDSVITDEKEQYLSLLQEVILKIDETLNDLVDVVQIRKDFNVEREELRFTERLQHVKDVLLVDIEKSGIRLTTSFEAAPVLMFPRVYLDSIFQNLITNAIRYRTDERIPCLHLESRREGSLIILTAEDNGVGIDMERFGSKLFGFRKTFHKNKDAKGLGLFITKTQVEAMGGSIRAESTPGQGTKFIITFKTE
ncbi:sensor histidine kinase [Chitinophaga tropicalis]|uniref:histidine kinase n=1 Tax=Chitinophaga tropicalis TaxID=2683588 RepID=A0A7K1U2S8_9BACT|nr:PAS domain-containing sensor histidine kinase [Chitinophaga tropicalis]MVT08674.1 PAS domain-containing protein [Chitinophaga tropicalis]